MVFLLGCWLRVVLVMSGIFHGHLVQDKKRHFAVAPCELLVLVSPADLKWTLSGQVAGLVFFWVGCVVEMREG